MPARQNPSGQCDASPAAEEGGGELGTTASHKGEDDVVEIFVREVEAPPAARYELIQQIGTGGMGVVHLARDQSLRRKVAFKQMREKVARDPQQSARFFTEVQITAQLDHPNIVPVYALEAAADGTVGYSMKLVEGKTLKQFIQEAREQLDAGCLDEEHGLATRLDRFLMVCEAMAFAHSKRVIHRDLKPANIMLGRYNQVYVMDWGICRLIGNDATEAVYPEQVDVGPETASATRTQYGSAIGTPSYMSPEQAAGRNSELDDRCDLYALGLILFELVSLERAYRGKATADVWQDVVRGKKQPLVAYRNDRPIPGDLRAIVEKATAFSRDHRYPNVSHLAEDIRRYLHGDAVSVRPDNVVRKLMRFMTKHRVATLSAMIVILVLGAGGTIGALVHSQRGLRAAAHREHRMNELLTSVATQSHRLDNALSDYEKSLLELAGRTTAVLAGPPSSKARYFLDADFQDPHRAPDDYAWSKVYHRPVSTRWPVFKLAPDVSPQAAEPTIQKLARLGPALESAVLASAGLDPIGQPSETVRREIADKGTPLTWVYVSLASGIHGGYPGKGGYPPAYDGRHRPFYRLAAERPGLHWGRPYFDALGQGLLVPCSTSILDLEQRFLGVAGFDLTLERLIDDLLVIDRLPSFEAAYLVDHEGNVVVCTEQRGSRYARAESDAAADGHLALHPLPYPEVIPLVRAGRSGPIEIFTPHHTIVVCYPLHSVGWHYVVVADGRRLLTAPGVSEPEGG